MPEQASAFLTAEGGSARGGRSSPAEVTLQHSHETGVPPKNQP